MRSEQDLLHLDFGQERDAVVIGVGGTFDFPV
jgi:hypothetical protein